MDRRAYGRRYTTFGNIKNWQNFVVSRTIRRLPGTTGSSKYKNGVLYHATACRVCSCSNGFYTMEVCFGVPNKLAHWNPVNGIEANTR
jgi:hypothetical protein